MTLPKVNLTLIHLFLESFSENRRVQRNANNNWSPWSTWSPCSEECMVGESQARSRQCLDKSGTSMANVLPCVGKVIIDLFIGARFSIFVSNHSNHLIIVNQILYWKTDLVYFQCLHILISLLIKAKRLLSI